MKVPVFLIMLACVPVLWAQEPVATEPTEPAVTPGLDIKPEDIRDTTVRTLGDRTLTFQRVEPIELAPPPQQQPVVNGEPAVRAAALESRFLLIGGSVYSAADAPGKYRTLVRYWPEQGGEEVALWSSANFLFLGGFASFVDGEGDEGVRWSLILSASEFHLESFTELPAGKRPGNIPAEMPELPAGAATFVVVKGSPTPQQLTPIQALHDLYNTRRDELEAAYRSRVELARQQAEQLKENPPEKKNLVFHHWRVDAPGKAQEAAAADQKEGGQ